VLIGIVFMEGLSRLPLGEARRPEPKGLGWKQRTLKSAIDCVGVGVHSGRRVNLTLRPAEAGTGIRFRRTDLRRTVAATYANVVDTRLATVVGEGSCRISTVEHILAALSGAGIDNALIELDGPEVPILDGSAAPFLFLLDCAGVVDLPDPRRVIEINRTVRVEENGAWAELRPLGAASRGTDPVLEMDLSIDFTAGAIGRQSCSLRLTPDSFRHQLASARTFAMAEDVEKLQAAGLALGGSLDNAVVVDGDAVLNPGGLRMPNEFAHHKLLDAVGDLFLAGGWLHARFVAHRSGHALNNRLLRTLFADAAAWQEAAVDPLAAAA
jgi:UDP-3-O-[3-hydroxymyristoyl] N-acetylglucosamine deacetylase